MVTLMAIIVYWDIALGILIVLLSWDFLKMLYIAYTENAANKRKGYINGTYGFMHSLIDNELIKLYEDKIQKDNVDLYKERHKSNVLMKEVLPTVIDTTINDSWQNKQLLFSLISISVIAYVIYLAFN